ncbi:peroxiredoxin [Pandoraea pnomenusa]|uniref:General stress protein 17o n=1 Tax=Pandoraea pnomenusa TaxID=93220 RepID=A0A378YMR7_9BURK|nr:Ohr family peroxiredoxin [Pandoraea pnomenusa]AHB08177.1 peroxiredoxin [Pandoraea pnomenusa 3kgm]AHN76062.1 peroxiredoxin [Pandoraea pnomenusa]AIU27355.1 peroxiredoxin [Pandoraea pnomenusa]SUA78456.1 General stress protein 17o [Pandoraea pnomenusa]VVE73414.1 peroxiredoxin [Pandoraea pnomenusa]
MSKLRPPPPSLLDKYRGRDFHPLYATSVTVHGGEAAHGRASGIAASDDGELFVNLRLPVELGGSGGGTNPEQLFAAGYAACFHGALSMLAERAGLSIPDASVTATITFGRDPVDGLFALQAEINIHLPDMSREVAEALVRNTERLCPYSKMTQDGIPSILGLTQ